MTMEHADDAQLQELVQHLQVLPGEQAATDEAVQQAQHAAVQACQGLVHQCLTWQHAQSAYRDAVSNAKVAEQVSAVPAAPSAGPGDSCSLTLILVQRS